MPDVERTYPDSAVRPSRREQALAAATRLFNRRSFAAVTLEAIAHEIGVTPSALYNHFESKEALVFECFSRGLRIYRDEIDRAREPGLDGLETVRRFIRGRLRPGEPRMITFSDLDALPRAHREIVHDARAGNVAMLSGAIKEGLNDGSIANGDPFLLSLAVFSVLDWMPFWYSENSYYTRQDAAEQLDDLLTHGVIRRDSPAVAPPPTRDLMHVIDRLSEPTKRSAKRDRLLRIATESFNLRGVVGSSLEHIAADAGVSRGAYYYHAPDKNSLLFLCLERAYLAETMLLEQLIESHVPSGDAIADACAFEFEVLRGVIDLHESHRGPKISFHNVPFLNDAQRVSLRALDRMLVGRNRGRYDRAIAGGVFRQLDSLFVQEIGAGLRNNIPSWSRLTAGLDLKRVADQFTSLFLFGMKPRTTQPRARRDKTVQNLKLG